jgi:hypothetical protein
MASNQSKLVRAATSGALSVATLLGISRLAKLPYSDSRTLNSDVLGLPGAVVGTIGSSLGLYDTPSPAWAVTCLIGNFAFYGFLWWLLLTLTIRRGTKVASD